MVAVIAMALVLVGSPHAWAQDPAPCRVLCTPKFKVEPTITFTNWFGSSANRERGWNGYTRILPVAPC
jgi:hypothetical protein